MKVFFSTLAITFLFGIFSSCYKAGKNGEFEIAAFPKHHTKSIPGAIVYLKYNAKEFPGDDPSLYDESGIADTIPGETPHVHFENLKRGNYYLYSVGWDSAISMEVKGGIPVTIKDKTGKMDITVPISED